MHARTVPSSVLLALAIAAGAVSAAAQAKTVHLTGTAYEFNNTKVRLAGAQVRVAEDPTLGATVRANGSYDLKVPDGRKITPYINAPGHHTIYLQTFTTDGQDLANVNFQVPSDAIYGALAALLKVPVDAAGNPSQCAIVSTFSTRDVRTLAFDAFTAYGAHGVAGATATASPALPAPVYFNKNVIPDTSQPVSSQDGGVIWPVVPAGTYTITAHHPSARFASFVATCKPGRIVNANPPWGLHQLGRVNPTKLTARLTHGRVTAIRATGLPRHATITLGSRTVVTDATTSTETLPLRPARRTVTVLATAPGYDGAALRVVNGRSTRLCVPLGETRPRASCAAG